MPKPIKEKRVYDFVHPIKEKTVYKVKEVIKEKTRLWKNDVFETDDFGKTTLDVFGKTTLDVLDDFGKTTRLLVTYDLVYLRSNKSCKNNLVFLFVSNSQNF